MDKLTRHHRKPKAQGGKGSGNYSYIPLKKHDAWHILFPGDWPPERIADEINRLYLDPAFKFVVERRC